MNVPPISMIYQGLFHTGAGLLDGPHQRTYQRTAKRMAFRVLTSGKLAAQLVYVFRSPPSGHGDRLVLGAWLIAGPDGQVSAHGGQRIGPGGPWDLADAIIHGSRHAVQTPALNGFYRQHPDAYQKLLEEHQASLHCLLLRHEDARRASQLYAAMHVHLRPSFVALLSAAIENRDVQLVLYDWLAERGFPHADELRSKRWNRGQWTENQLLGLLSKRFTTTRRSFSGRTK